jgi:DNA polymerase I
MMQDLERMAIAYNASVSQLVRTAIARDRERMILKYGVEGNHPIVHRWTRQNGVRVHTIDYEFRPYFYVHDDIDVFAAAGNLSSLIRQVTHTDKKTIEGRGLQKVYTGLPRDVKTIRDLFSEHYEADIPFTTRYMLDCLNLDDFGEPYKVMYLDIELGAPLGAPIDGSYPIICMSTMCNGKIKRFMNVGNENLLLQAFIRHLGREDPDVLAGWNVDFDISRIINRLGKKSGKLSPLGYVHGGDKPSVPGRLLFDLYGAYRKIKIGAPIRPRNFSLNTVAEFEFKWTMPSWSRKILQIFNNNPDDAMEYNVKHTKLCQMIDAEYSLTQTFTERQKTALCEFRDAHYDSVMFDRLLLRKSPYALPSKPDIGKKKDSGRYTGATVFDPKPGVHQDVCLYDFRSLYPSIVLSLNVSPETLAPEPEADFWLNEINVGFNAAPIGLMPTIIKELLDKRAKIKSMSKKKGDAYDLQQYALKVVANAAYGAFGYSRFRLYNRDIARSITYVGRSALESTRDFLQNNYNLDVIYGDTDSFFVKGVAEAEDLVPEINEHIRQWLESEFGVKSSQIEVEYEAHYRSIFFGKEKKRYAGLDDAGNMTIKGLEMKRRDCPLFGKNLQRDVMAAVLEGKSKKEVVAIARVILERLKSGGYTLREMGIPRALSKPMNEYVKSPDQERIRFAWAQAVEDTNRAMRTVYTGQEDELYFIYALDGIRAVVAGDEDLYKDTDLNMLKMIEMGITRRVRAIFDAMEWDTALITEGMEQKKLADFID